MPGALKWRMFKRNLSKFLWRTLKFILVIGIMGGVVYYLAFFKRKVEKPIAIARDEHHLESYAADPVMEINKAIEESKYDFAKDEIEKKLQMNPDHIAIRTLRSKVMDSLQIDFKFNYLPHRGRAITTRNSSGEGVLTSKDPYYLVLHTAEECYLYVFQLRSSGTLVKLFPDSKYSPILNPVPSGSVRIPNGMEWIYLDNVAGTETIYVLASRWKQKNLEPLMNGLNSALHQNAKAKIIEQIIMHLEREEQATDTVPGLAFAKHQFYHEANQ